MKTNVWDRRENESIQAYEAFCLYRDMGADRSCVKVGQKLGKSATIITRWSFQHDWVARARAYDMHLDKEAQKITEKRARDAIVKMNERQIDTGSRLQELVRIKIKVLEKLVDEWKSSGEDPKTCPLNGVLDKDLIAYYKLGFDTERTVRGEVTNLTGVEENEPRARRVTILMSDPGPPTDNDDTNTNEPQSEPRLKDSPEDI